MKTKYILLVVSAFCTASLLPAAEKFVAGPKGGRLLDTEPQKAEFFVNAERKVEVTFYDAALKTVPPAEQSVAITVEPKSGKAPLALQKTATGFVSTTPLPSGDPYRIVVQVRETAGMKPKNFRIDLNLADCAECKHAEYACTCAGH